MFSCPQVVYSSSARELKVETVKPDTPEKEEDDIDIDAIWETRVMMMLFLTCGFDSRCPVLAKWLAFSLLYYLPHHHPSLRSLLRLVAWFNIALYLLHINAVILKCIQLMKLSHFWGFESWVIWGFCFDCTFFFFLLFFYFGPCIFPVNKEWMFCYPAHLTVSSVRLDSFSLVGD